MTETLEELERHIGKSEQFVEKADKEAELVRKTMSQKEQFAFAKKVIKQVAELVALLDDLPLMDDFQLWIILTGSAKQIKKCKSATQKIDMLEELFMMLDSFDFILKAMQELDLDDDPTTVNSDEERELRKLLSFYTGFRDNFFKNLYTPESLRIHEEAEAEAKKRDDQFAAENKLEFGQAL